MYKTKKLDELRQLLVPFIKEAEEKKNTVREENVEDLLLCAEVDGVEVQNEIIDYIKANPDTTFWKLLEFLKPGIDPDVDMDDLME